MSANKSGTTIICISSPPFPGVAAGKFCKVYKDKPAGKYGGKEIGFGFCKLRLSLDFCSIQLKVCIIKIRGNFQGIFSELDRL